MPKYFYILLLTICLGTAYGFGEKPQNAAPPELKAIYPAGLTALTDRNRATAAAYSFVILDLHKDYYLRDITLYQTDLPAKLQTSSDGIGYDLVPTSAIVSANPIIYDLAGFNGRYLRITNTTTQSCTEITVATAPEFRPTYVSINAVPEATACTFYVQTTGKGYLQLLYGMNYDFIYYKKLPGIFSLLSMTREETIRIGDLKPDTTYRYQFRLRDLRGTVIESNYFTFTTLPVVK